MLAFDLKDTEERDAVLTRLKENLLALPCGEKSIRLRPHLTFSRADVDAAVKFISLAL
jgi:L-lysine 6-transaminase